jgi:hypothetical protein
MRGNVRGKGGIMKATISLLAALVPSIIVLVGILSADPIEQTVLTRVILNHQESREKQIKTLRDALDPSSPKDAELAIFAKHVEQSELNFIKVAAQEPDTNPIKRAYALYLLHKELSFNLANLARFEKALKEEDDPGLDAVVKKYQKEIATIKADIAHIEKTSNE